jgi:hemerythrin
MAIAVWNDNLRINIPEIDIQHKKWIDLMNALHDAMKAGKSKEVLNSAINSLMAYTQVHFKAEERFLAENNYTDLANHKLQHQKFVEKIQEFRHKYESGQLGLSIEVMQFLSDWFVNHIKRTDVEYAKELNSVPV